MQDRLTSGDIESKKSLHLGNRYVDLLYFIQQPALKMGVQLLSGVFQRAAGSGVKSPFRVTFGPNRTPP